MLATVFGKTVRDRWKGIAIGGGSLALTLLFAMAVYRDIDITIYTEDLPEAFRKLFNIPEDTEVGGLAYGAVYSTYGGLTLAGIPLAMGAASIAGEERNGTLGLLLGNPKSRTHILVSKAGALVLLALAGTLIMWVAGLVVPEFLNVDVDSLHIGALMVHMFVIAVFHGFLAIAIGAWTGRGALASATSAGVMIISLFAVGLLPLVEGLEGLAKVFPWYYYEGGDPLHHGIVWGHLAVLVTAAAVLVGLAVYGVNRRDLRGQALGVTLLDRLRAFPLTQKIVDRLAGSTRVSHIWIKTVSERQGVLIATSYAMLLMGAMIGPMYTLVEDALGSFADDFPEALLALVGNGDMGTPEGFYQVEIFGLMAPIAVMVVGVAIAARALAGEEERRTMGLLLANPVKRSRIVLEKSLAMGLHAMIVGFITFAGAALGSLLGGLGMSMGNLAATSLLATLVGLVFSALALALSAGLGRSRVAVFGAVGAALVFHLLNAFLSLSDSLAGLARWSPFYYYLTSDPLVNGMHWGHAAVLAGLSAVLVVASVVLFGRRDLRQSG